MTSTSEEIKSPWHADRPCPRCRTLLRLQGVTETDKFRYERVVCGVCGFTEQMKTPLEVAVARRIEIPEAPVRAPRYGFRIARRIPKEGSDE